VRVCLRHNRRCYQQSCAVAGSTSPYPGHNGAEAKGPRLARQDHKDGLGDFLGLVMIAQVPQRGGIDEVDVSCDQGGKRLFGVPPRTGDLFYGQLFLTFASYVNETLIIVPTVNERENLARMAAKLLSLPVKVDLLVVDGNSSDGTAQIADELAAKHPEIHVIHETKKSGLGRAYIAGFKWALEKEYGFIMEMDCDFSHDPDEIPNFLATAKNENADLVLGSRYSGGVRVVNWPLKRLMLSRSAGIYVRAITGMPITDPTGGYKCFRRRALEAINLDDVRSNGYSFQIEMTHRLWRDGFKVVEVPIVFTERLHGHSKMSGHIVQEALIMVWRLWFQNGLRRWPRKSR
jgi:dolichol-phosphate mannosyltransferase